MSAHDSLQRSTPPIPVRTAVTNDELPLSPAGGSSNWIPTDARGRFEVLARFYGPQKPLFDKTWRLSDLEKVR